MSELDVLRLALAYGVATGVAVISCLGTIVLGIAVIVTLVKGPK